MNTHLQIYFIAIRIMCSKLDLYVLNFDKLNISVHFPTFDAGLVVGAALYAFSSLSSFHHICSCFQPFLLPHQSHIPVFSPVQKCS